MEFKSKRLKMKFQVKRNREKSQSTRLEIKFEMQVEKLWNLNRR